MTDSTHVLGTAGDGRRPVRVAAAGDIHCDESGRAATAQALEAVDAEADLILLAGDLTTHGEPEQAAVLAEACEGVEAPVVAVLGNHDLHAGRRDELVAVLEEGGVDVLDRRCATYAVAGTHVGVAGAKGFVGGFRGMGLPDFGEPSLRAVYAETTAEVDALGRALAEVALCPLRIALLHYAPLAETLHGEPPEIWTMLGSDRLAAPILEHRPDLVLHGHAHAGAFEADLDGIPVHNVSVPVMGRDFWVFELIPAARTPTTIH